MIKPRHPQTNGLIERFNGRVAAVLKTTTFTSARHWNITLQKSLHLYHHDIPQKNLGHVTPVAKLKEHYHTKPALFQKRPINYLEPDIYDKTIYRLRGRIERSFGRFKEHKRLSMRYEKSDAVFLAFIALAAIKTLI